MFERVEKPTEVSGGRHAKISEALENDFRGISEDILKKNPDYQSIKTDPNYRAKLNESFEKVAELADQIPETVKKRQLSAFMKRRFQTEAREMKGITPSETEETFRKEFAEFYKKVSEGPEEARIPTLVEQFRKNNGELAEYFEPGKSRAFNTGKRDALLEYNRSIQELFETVHPNSEFTKLFKEQNKRWSQLSDVEFIEGKLGDIFKEGKVNFKDVAKLLDKGKTNLRRPFQRIMGKEGFKNFEGLLKDFLSVEKPYSLLKKAEIAGFKDLLKLAGSYIIHPSLTKLYAGGKLLRSATRVLLDKPEIALTWKNAFDSLKAGKYAESEAQFKELDSEVKKLSAKVKPFEARARTLPEGYSPSIEKKPTDIYGIEKGHKTPTVEEIRKFNLKDKPDYLTEWDNKVFSSTSGISLSKNEKTLFKNSWDALLNKEKFNIYYSDDYGPIGTVGDYIKDPNLRKIYKDVLNTEILKIPLEENTGGSYNRVKNFISIKPGFSPSQFYANIIHESHHALQENYGLFEKYPYTSKTVHDRRTYLQHRLETKARLAQRYARKDLLKAKHASDKAEKLMRRTQVRREAGTLNAML